MCTVTWILRDDGAYDLFANRDEQRTRSVASLPRVRVVGGTRVACPTDGDAGGTWIGVNEHGLSACLLNGNPRAGDEPSAGFTSRGRLVLTLLEQRTIEEAAAHLEAVDLDAYRGFRVLLLGPGRSPCLRTWNGTRCTGEPAETPLVSSTRHPEEAARARRATWRSIGGGSVGVRANIHLAYHRSHEPARGPYSVCMHRSDARTVSLSWIAVRPEGATIRYAPGPPCRTPLGKPLRLALRPDAGVPRA